MNPKKIARYTLNYLAVIHIFLAAACWRMNGIYTERVVMSDNIELTQFIATGYAMASAILLTSGLLILLSVKIHRGKHAA